MKREVSKESVIGRRKSDDPAPDWIDHTIGSRLTMCITQLSIAGLLKQEEALEMVNALDEWEREQSERL